MKRSYGKLSNRILAGTMTFIMALSVMLVPVSAKAENAELEKSAIAEADLGSDLGSDLIESDLIESDLIGSDLIESDLIEVELQKISGISVLKGKALQTVNSLTNALGDSTTTVVDRNWRAYCSQYVFDQMNAEEKELYNNLETVCMSYAKNSSENAISKKYSDNGQEAYGYYLTPAEYKNLNMEQVQAVIQLFMYQNPQYYFATVSLPCLYTSKEVYLPCYEEFADGETRATVTNSLFAEIDSVVAEISKAEKSKDTRNYDIERAAHDYLCGELSYNENADFSQSIYSVFTSKNTVCLGYSLSFELLLNAAGVSTVTTYSDWHAWNKVYVDNSWYAVDVTWDDQDWGILDDWFNKSDDSICFDDSELCEHTIKAPKYFPAASADYVDGSADDSDNTAVNNTKTTTKINNNVQNNTSETDELTDDDSNNDLTTSPTISSSETVDTIKIDDVDSDTKEKTVKISGTKLSKVKAGSKKCAITWKKVKGIDGYEIQLSTSKKFKKIAKKAKISSSKSTTTIKKLKKKTTYYVRIRTYKKVNGKTQTSSWSGVKKVTIK